MEGYLNYNKCNYFNEVYQDLIAAMKQDNLIYEDIDYGYLWSESTAQEQKTQETLYHIYCDDKRVVGNEFRVGDENLCLLNFVENGTLLRQAMNYWGISNIPISTRMFIDCDIAIRTYVLVKLLPNIILMLNENTEAYKNSLI